MCGRYYLDETLMEYLSENYYELSTYELGDIFPSKVVPVIRSKKDKLMVSEMVWGFPSGKNNKELIINARAESVKERPMFKTAVKYRRCVIPAVKYYEWNKEREKVTFERQKEEEPAFLFMAGLYDLFEEERVVILTTEANDSVKSVHHRMPLILEKEEVYDWILKEEMSDVFLRKVPALLKKSQEYEQLTFSFLD